MLTSQPQQKVGRLSAQTHAQNGRSFSWYWLKIAGCKDTLRSPIPGFSTKVPYKMTQGGGCLDAYEFSKWSEAIEVSLDIPTGSSSENPSKPTVHSKLSGAVSTGFIITVLG